MRTNPLLPRTAPNLKYACLLPAFAIALGIGGCGGKQPNHDPKNVFGADERVELDINTSPGRAIGKLDGGCTATMIGMRLAVTAAHCIISGDSSSMRSDVRYFKSGLKNATAVATSWVSAAWLGTKKPDTDRRNDWAVLLLAEDIGTKTGWFGVKAGNVAESLPFTVSLAAYGTDKDHGEVPQVTKYCYIHKVDEQNRLLHDCDSASGAAGGPLYVGSGADAYIVGLAVAEFRNGDTSLRRDAYSHEFANIAVSADRFLGVIEKLRSTVDAGLAAPEMESIFTLTNTNPSAATAPATPPSNTGNSASPGTGAGSATDAPDPNRPVDSQQMDAPRSRRTHP